MLSPVIRVIRVGLAVLLVDRHHHRHYQHKQIDENITADKNQRVLLYQKILYLLEDQQEKSKIGQTRTQALFFFGIFNTSSTLQPRERLYHTISLIQLDSMDL